MPTPEQVRLLISTWDSLELFLQQPGNELESAIVDSLCWMQEGWTKTRDDQDLLNPHKPFTKREYLETLHKVWLAEPFLFVEKSRTMLCSWWAAVETLHYVMTHQPSKGIFWAQDQDRAIALLDYARTLYSQQKPILKAIFPLDRPLDRQAFNRFELKDGGILTALPGKDPDKVRSEHPTVIVLDEAAFIDNGAEAFDIAISSRLPRVLVISSAAPSWFRSVTKHAVPISLDRYL
jgi:hypothetical protein